MKKLLKNLPFEVSTVIFSAIAIVVGAILSIFPDTSLKFISLVIGIAIGIKGLMKLFKYISDSRIEQGKTFDLIIASLILGASIILMIHPQPILSIFPVLVGLGILIYGIVGLFGGGRNRTTVKVSSIVAIVLGVVVINAPMLFAEATTLLVGISLIAVGIFSIITQIKIKKKLDQLNLPPSDGYTEVEFKDIDE